MTDAQIKYRAFVQRGMDSYNGDISRAIVWCSNRFDQVNFSDHCAIQMLTPQEKNQVIHELTMQSVVTG